MEISSRVNNFQLLYIYVFNYLFLFMKTGDSQYLLFSPLSVIQYNRHQRGVYIMEAYEIPEKHSVPIPTNRREHNEQI